MTLLRPRFLLIALFVIAGGMLFSLGLMHFESVGVAHAGAAPSAVIGHPYRALYVPTVIAADATATLPADAGAPAGSAAPVAAPAPTADQLHDPTTDPGKAFDELKDAKHYGWAVLVFAALLMLCKLVPKLISWSKLAWLGKGKAAVVVAAIGAIAASCYNVAVSGGSLFAMALAAALALAHYVDAAKPASS